MEKITKDLFGGEVLTCGFTKADNGYYKSVYKNFTANNVKVYPLPTIPESDLDFETYPSLADLPHVPKCAFVIRPNEKTPALVEELQKAGVKKILFYSQRSAGEELIKNCEKKGLEVSVGCPLVLYGSGICALHAFFGGYRSERKK